MKKDKSIRGMAVAAAILSGCNVILNCLFVLFPQIVVPLFWGTRMESYSFGYALPFMLIQAILPVMLLIIALVNIKSDTFQEQKGIGTAVAIGVCWVLGMILSAGLHSLYRLYTGSDMLALYSAVSTAQSFIGFLSTVARFLLISIASIEIYVTSKNLSEIKQDNNNY
ncbi:MAG: hypothetical protein K2H29_10070 [Oscillospiraceae bacterium]|nr:hypothetical protein [Oscillospiraceae bacterium]